MTWDDSWPTVAEAARALDAPVPRAPDRLVTATPGGCGGSLRSPVLVTATPMPRVRGLDPVAGAETLDGAWRRRLERWREVRALLDRHPTSSWPRTSAPWGWEAGDERAPLEVGGDSWRPLAAGVRGAVALARPRRVLVRGGRRCGKSSNICELAVADATSGSWAISAGDVGLPDRLVSLARLDMRAARA